MSDNIRKEIGKVLEEYKAEYPEYLADVTVDEIVQLRDKLMEVAKKSWNYRVGTIRYKEVMMLYGLNHKIGNHRKKIGYYLFVVSEYEKSKGRPPLSALVVGVNGKPAIMFFKVFNDTDLNDDEFLNKVQKKIWNCKHWDC